MEGQWTIAAVQELAGIVVRYGGIPFQSLGRDLILPTAHRYKHVGNATRGDSKMCSDVSAKMGAIMWSAKKLKSFVVDLQPSEPRITSA